MTSKVIATKAVAGQSHRVYPENWNGDGWVAVPPELEELALSCAPYCELVLVDGVLVDILPTEHPPEQETAPTDAEQLRADVDFLAAMQGVAL